jgi:hypothetical protein
VDVSQHDEHTLDALAHHRVKEHDRRVVHVAHLVQRQQAGDQGLERHRLPAQRARPPQRPEHLLRRRSTGHGVCQRVQRGVARGGGLQRVSRVGRVREEGEEVLVSARRASLRTALKQQTGLLNARSPAVALEQRAGFDLYRTAAAHAAASAAGRRRDPSAAGA